MFDSLRDKFKGTLKGLNFPVNDEEDVKISELIEKSTSESLFAPNWNTNLEVVEYINTKEGASEKVLEAMKKILTKHSPRSQVLLLTLLETCVKNCHPSFHLALGKSGLWLELLSLLPSPAEAKVNAEVQTKIVNMVEAFAKNLKPLHFQDAYGLLLDRGFAFPNIEDDATPYLSPPLYGDASGGNRGYRPPSVEHRAGPNEVPLSTFASGGDGALSRPIQTRAGHFPSAMAHQQQHPQQSWDPATQQDTFNALYDGNLPGQGVAAGQSAAAAGSTLDNRPNPDLSALSREDQAAIRQAMAELEAEARVQEEEALRAAKAVAFRLEQEQRALDAARGQPRLPLLQTAAATDHATPVRHPDDFPLVPSPTTSTRATGGHSPLGVFDESSCPSKESYGALLDAPGGAALPRALNFGRTDVLTTPHPVESSGSPARDLEIQELLEVAKTASGLLGELLASAPDDASAASDPLLRDVSRRCVDVRRGLERIISDGGAAEGAQLDVALQQHEVLTGLLQQHKERLERSKVAARMAGRVPEPQPQATEQPGTLRQTFANLAAKFNEKLHINSGGGAASLLGSLTSAVGIQPTGVPASTSVPASGEPRSGGYQALVDQSADQRPMQVQMAALGAEHSQGHPAVSPGGVFTLLEDDEDGSKHGDYHRYNRYASYPDEEDRAARRPLVAESGVAESDPLSFAATQQQYLDSYQQYAPPAYGDNQYDELSLPSVPAAATGPFDLLGASHAAEPTQGPYVNFSSNDALLIVDPLESAGLAVDHVGPGPVDDLFSGLGSALYPPTSPPDLLSGPDAVLPPAAAGQAPLEPLGVGEPTTQKSAADSVHQD